MIAGGEKMQDFRGDYCQRPLRHYGAFRERFMQNLSAWLVIHSFRGGDFGALPSINVKGLSIPLRVEPLQNGDQKKAQKPYFASLYDYLILKVSVRFVADVSWKIWNILFKGNPEQTGKKIPSSLDESWQKLFGVQDVRLS